MVVIAVVGIAVVGVTMIRLCPRIIVCIVVALIINAKEVPHIAIDAGGIGGGVLGS